MLERSFLPGGGGEARESQQFLAPLEILPDAFLDHRAEGVPYLAEILCIFLAQAFEFADHAAGHGFAYLGELRIILQHLARKIEGKILAVDHAANETEIGGQQIGIVGNEDAPNIEFDVTLARRLKQIERLGRGRKQQNRIGLPAFGAIVQRHGRIVEGATDRTVGLLVIFGFQLRLRPLPQGTCRIDLPRFAVLRLKLDRKLDVVGIGADDPLDLVALQIFFRLRLQMQNDLGTASDALPVLFSGRSDIESVAARRGPCPHLRPSGASAGDGNAIGDHEGRVKTDAELADQAGPILGFGEPRQKGFGAGTRNGAEVVDQLLPVHADTIVDHGERAGILVRRDAYPGRLAVGGQIGRRDSLVTQFVQRVGAVRNQLAQEDIGLGINRMHHQVQKLGDLGLKRLVLGNSIRRHCRSRSTQGKT